MVEWLSVAQLSKTLEIPETTVRRYLGNFEEYFRSEQIGRGRKFHPESVEILQRIAMLYGQDYDTAGIKRILSDEYAFSVESMSERGATTQPPAYDLGGKLDAFQQQQEEFNKKLLQQLVEQQKYINELVESRDKEVEENKRLFSPEEKRAERFDLIMAERKVKRLLEKEAMNLWLEKPEEERMKKVGWFRKEEDRDKRDLFINEHVDTHFETQLKKEMDLD